MKRIPLLGVFFICVFHSCINAATLEAYPAHFEILQNITVKWTGITHVYDNDIVAVYSPASDPNFKYMGFKNASMCANYTSGSCQITFEVLNMRTPYQFRYFHLLKDGDLELVASSNLVHVNPNIPMQGHLQLTKDISEMRVMWVQGITADASIVEYKQSGTSNVRIAKGISFTYTLDQLRACSNTSNAVHNWRDPGQIHDVLLQGLKHNTTYLYRYGTSKQMSEWHHFTTRREVGPHQGINIIPFGDLGTYKCQNDDGWCQPGSKGTSARLAELLQRRQWDMILQIGDISYAVGNPYRWDQYFWQIEPIATRIPWMTTIGNHEYDHDTQPFKPSWSNYGDDSFGECGIPFFYRFHPPDNDLWWSLEMGNVHFTMISMEHDFTRGSEQYMWLTKDLSTVDRQRTPFVVVSGHRPMYCSGDYEDQYIMAQHIREELEDVLYEHRVDLALYGHYHSYERSCPVYKEKCISADRGVVHVVIGMAGQYLMSEWMPQPDWSAFRDGEHYGLTTLHTNSTTMWLTYFPDYHHQPMDEVYIHRKF